MDSEISNGNTGNKKGNSSYDESVTVSRPKATQVVLDFLEAEPFRQKAWSPIAIAEETQINYGTVRKTLFYLKKAGKAFSVNHEWSATKVCSNDFTRLLKYAPFKGGILPCVHNLTLTVEAKSIGVLDFSESMSNIRVLGTVKVHPEGIRCSFGDNETIKTSFLLSKCSLTVWLGCTFMPLDFEALIRWMMRVDGGLDWLKLPAMEDNLFLWRVCQFGLNFDGKEISSDFEKSDDPVKSVSMKAFGDWFARMYNKKFPDGSIRTRLEVHASPQGDSSVKDFFGVLTRRMSEVIAERQNAEMVAIGVNGVNAHIMEMTRKIGQLDDRISKLSLERSPEGQIDKATSVRVKRTLEIVEKLDSTNKNKLDALNSRLSMLCESDANGRLEAERLETLAIDLADKNISLIEEVKEEKEESRKLRFQLATMTDAFNRMTSIQKQLASDEQRPKAVPMPSSTLYE